MKQICNSGLQILRRRHLSVVYLMTLSKFHTTCHMIQRLAMNCKDVKTSGHGFNTIQESAWTDCGKPQKFNFQPEPTK